MSLAHISYRPLEVSSVAEMLDPSRPLVKSQQPLTKPTAPAFADPNEAEKRKQERAAKKAAACDSTSKIYQQRISERKFIKAQFEFEREKRIAEQTIYRKEKEGVWKSKLATSPFLVDLVADNERIEEEVTVKEQEERRRQKEQEVRRKKVKNEMIVKTLSEIPSDQARVSRRLVQEEERRQKALRDLERVDQLWERKQQDTAEMMAGRQQRLEQAALTHSAKGGTSRRLIPEEEKKVKGARDTGRKWDQKSGDLTEMASERPQRIESPAALNPSRQKRL